MRRAAGPLLALLGLGLAAAACSRPVHRTEPYRPPAYFEPTAARGAPPLAVGRHLYQRDCSYCHGTQGEGTERGPDLVSGTNGPALTDFMLRTGRMPINEPVSQADASDPKYSEREMAAVVAYVDREFSPRGPDIPEVHLAEADLAEGQQLYQEHCAACHALTGIGGAMLARKKGGGGTEGVHIPDFGGSDPLEIAEAVRTGPGTMPVFGLRAISDEELNAVVRYTAYLRDPNDHGGAPIGHVGPVAEGAVGWILGVGLLLVFTRWIGTKTGERP